MTAGSPIPELARVLAALASVAKFDEVPGSESWALAHALVDIEESAKKLHETLLPRLKAASSTADAELVLTDIGEELRHILYHVDNSKFFAYLL